MNDHQLLVGIKMIFCKVQFSSLQPQSKNKGKNKKGRQIIYRVTETCLKLNWEQWYRGPLNKIVYHIFLINFGPCIILYLTMGLNKPPPHIYVSALFFKAPCSSTLARLPISCLLCVELCIFVPRKLDPWLLSTSRTWY